MAKDTEQNYVPAKMGEVSFNDQIAQVQQSLESRTGMKKQLRDDWKAIVDAFREHDYEMAVKRQSPDYAYGRLMSIKVYEPEDDSRADMRKLNNISSDGIYYLSQLAQRPKFLAAVEEKVPGVAALVQDAKDMYDHGSSKVLDEAATKEARAKVRALIDVLHNHVEEYEETEDTLFDVDRVILTAEKIANISAIANSKK